MELPYVILALGLTYVAHLYVVRGLTKYYEQRIALYREILSSLPPRLNEQVHPYVTKALAKRDSQ